MDLYFRPIVTGSPGIDATSSPKQQNQTAKTGEGDFKQLFEQELLKNSANLSFSKHAVQRINERQIDVTPQLLNQVSNAVERAEAKGIKDALILNGQTAFIVNVPSRTVVTTMNGQDMNNNVITNIDGTVLL